MSGELEYTGLMAIAWDPLRGDTSGWADRAFFRAVIADVGQPVLDVGCGTGRLLLDYLFEGVDIDGCEISPDMIAILTTNAAARGLDVASRVHRAEMESLDLARRYQLVMVPSGSFQLVLDPTDAARAMARFYAHLVPGGTLAMAWLDIARDHPGGEDDCFTQEAPLADGSVIRRTYRAWFDVESQLEHTDDLYERLVDGVVVEHERQVREPATRNYLRSEIEAMHHAAGFVGVRMLSVTTMEPVESGSRVVMTLARRPEQPT